MVCLKLSFCYCHLLGCKIMQFICFDQEKIAFCYLKYHFFDRLLLKVYQTYGRLGVFLNNNVCKTEQKCQIVSKTFFEKKERVVN